MFQVNCVLVGFDPHLSYAKMIKAATYATQKNNLFLATNEDPFLPTKHEVVVPGENAFKVQLLVNIKDKFQAIQVKNSTDNLKGLASASKNVKSGV